MYSSMASLWLLLLAIAYASPLKDLQTRQIAVNKTQGAYSIPNGDPSSVANTARAADIEVKRTTFLYGPGVDGGPSSPSGVLGAAYISASTAQTGPELLAQVAVQTNDSTKATADADKYDDLKTVDDYKKLYDGEWGPSSAPTGIDPGILSNYTSDLLLGMSRLSFSPFAIRRLDSAKDTLPFEIDSNISQKVAGASLSDLLKEQRLFYVDHREQSKLAWTDLHSASCDAYFYLSKDSKFLPLAIRTNTGANLIYTPADTDNDWLLAKMMFEINDFYFAQIDHLARTHWTAEIAYQAAVRTLSDAHPVLGLLNRRKLMYGAFAVRPLAVATLFNKGGVFDSYFAHGGNTTAGFADTLYNQGAGSWQGNQLETDLTKRGLINSNGPKLPSFPFYEDAKALQDKVEEFIVTFVDSYYSDDSKVADDKELQNWLKEANGPAKVMDFISSLTQRAQLVKLLTHFVYLTTTAHHAVNLNQLITGAGAYPLHLQALYQPLPTEKGVQNVVQYMPPLKQCIGFIVVSARFARPLFAGTDRSFVHLFDGADFLALTNNATQAANKAFVAAMEARSAQVSKRSFDASGLSQGMPFVWRALDPGVMARSLTI